MLHLRLGGAATKAFIPALFRIKRKREKENVKKRERKLHLRIGGAATEAFIP